MRPRTAADLPRLTTRAPLRGRDQRCRDVLLKKPQGGDHWWVRISVSGLSNRQVVSAMARAAGVAVELIGDAGGRDRQALAERWLSVPKSEVEHPKRLRNAGSHSKLRVLEVTEGRRPVSPREVVAVAWELRLSGAAADEGYLRGRAILDTLRRDGFPNYLSAPATNPAQARLGRLLAQGKSLPPRAAAGANKRRLLYAYQARLANMMIAERAAGGELSSAWLGDVVEVGGNKPPHQRVIEVVTDPEAAERRIASWEAVPMVPLFGQGLTKSEHQTAAFEAAVLEREGVRLSAFARLNGSRRAYRMRPAQASIDLDGADLMLRCQLPTTSYVDQLLAEFWPDEAGVPSEDGTQADSIDQAPEADEADDADQQATDQVES